MPPYNLSTELEHCYTWGGSALHVRLSFVTKTMPQSQFKYHVIAGPSKSLASCSGSTITTACPWVT